MTNEDLHRDTLVPTFTILPILSPRFEPDTQFGILLSLVPAEMLQFEQFELALLGYIFNQRKI